MYLADSHMHSLVSRDSDSARIDMAAGAVACGLNEICFTDHFDIPDIDGNHNPDYSTEQQRVFGSLRGWGK